MVDDTELDTVRHRGRRTWKLADDLVSLVSFRYDIHAYLRPSVPRHPPPPSANGVRVSQPCAPICNKSKTMSTTEPRHATPRPRPLSSISTASKT
jgi:hypothetical protein